MSDKEIETTVEEEKLVEEPKKTTTKKTSTKRTSTKKENFVSNADFLSFKKEVESVLNTILLNTKKVDENMDMLVSSINDIVKRVDILEKKIDSFKQDDKEDNETTAKLDILKARVEDVSEDVGDLIDKVDVIFAGNTEDKDLLSRIEKLEKVIYGRLHKSNA